LRRSKPVYCTGVPLRSPWSLIIMLAPLVPTLIQLLAHRLVELSWCDHRSIDTCIEDGAYEKRFEKTNRRRAWFTVGIVDLSERGLAPLWLATAAPISTICDRGKYCNWYETNPALYPAWANNLER
jgi:hypothetical protein